MIKVKRLKFVLLSLVLVSHLFSPHDGVQSIGLLSPIKVEATEISEELADYLTQLRQSNHRWANRLHTLLESDLPASKDVVDPRFSVADNHQVIQSLYYMFLSTYESYLNDNQPFTIARDLYSDTFVFEKMLLPEFSDEDLEALDQLRVWLTLIVYESYQLNGNNQSVTDEFSINIPDFAKQLAVVDQLTDAEFHDANLIALNTGVASEAYKTSLNEKVDGMEQEPFEANWFIHEVHPLSSDIRDYRLSAYNHNDNQVWFGFLLSTPIEPAPVIDYQTRYAVRFTNHYPEFSNRYIKPKNNEYTHWTEEKSQKLAEYMQVWGAEMGQSYLEYHLNHPVDFFGVQVPTNSFYIDLEGEKRKVSTQPGSELYLLAVYSDIEDTVNPLAERHLYLFVEDVGKPRVLIAVNGPNQEGILTFKDTANQALHDGFISIYE